MLRVVLSALVYTLPLMPFAYAWHMVWFRQRYTQWQYFDGQANVPLGFASMVAQGIILSLAYAGLMSFDIQIHPLVFAGAIGVYHWTVHVLAAMAKHSATRTWGYLLLETVFLAGQFGMFGALLTVVYRN